VRCVESEQYAFGGEPHVTPRQGSLVHLPPEQPDGHVIDDAV
jgi:hypothetical protein